MRVSERLAHSGLVASATSRRYNGIMSTLNERAWELCNAMARDAASLGIAVQMLDCGTRIIGHGLEKDGRMFCCDHCAEHEGVKELRDRA